MFPKRAASRYQGGMIWTIPNILTAGRLMAAMALPLVYLTLPHPFSDAIVLLLFIGAAATDWLDGWIARRSGRVTALGRMLDPIADKAMVGVALLAVCGLYGAHWLVMVPAAAILIREFAVSGLREFLAGRPVNLAVSNLAKWKTAVQMVAISLLFLGTYANFAGLVTECVICGRPSLSVIDITGIALLWVAAVMTLVTGWQYFARGLDVILEEDR